MLSPCGWLLPPRSAGHNPHILNTPAIPLSPTPPTHLVPGLGVIRAGNSGPEHESLMEGVEGVWTPDWLVCTWKACLQTNRKDFLSLGTGQPWEGQALQDQQGPRCQSIKNQKQNDMINILTAWGLIHLGGSAPLGLGGGGVMLIWVLSVLFILQPICATSTGYYDYIISLNNMQTNEI